jgi:hypothetical protein
MLRKFLGLELPLKVTVTSVPMSALLGPLMVGAALATEIPSRNSHTNLISVERASMAGTWS